MSWDNEKTLSFIKEYENRPILWQKEHKLYYNVAKKEDAWREISGIFDEEIDFLKKKIDSLRGSRRRERNRMRKSIGTGKGRKDIYISKWFAWESLQFLDDPEEICPTMSNNPASENEEVDEDNAVNSEQNSVHIIDGDNEEASQVESHNDTLVTSQKKTSLPPKSPARRKRRTEDPRVDEAYNILKAKLTPGNKDECAMFADYIAEKMRKLDDRTRAILQHHIHGFVLQAEMGTLEMQSPISPQPPTQFNPFTQTPSNSYHSFRSYSSPSYSLPSPPAYSATRLQSQASQNNQHTSQQNTLFSMQPPIPRQPSTHTNTSNMPQISYHSSQNFIDSFNYSSQSSTSPSASSYSATPLQSPQNNEHTSQQCDKPTSPQSVHKDGSNSLQEYFSSFSNVNQN